MVWRGFKFSDEPPHVDPEDPYADPVALLEYREWALRRKYIDIEKAKVWHSQVASYLLPRQKPSKIKCQCCSSVRKSYLFCSICPHTSLPSL